MRLLQFAVLIAVFGAPAHAQTPPTIGPILGDAAINADLFDAVFEVPVTLVPALPLLLGQSLEARFDAIVCNASSSGTGWVKVDPAARWGVLDPGVCTMFASFKQLQLTTPGNDMSWTAKIYLRASRGH